MGIFLLIDTAYLAFWTAAYPFQRNVIISNVSILINLESDVASRWCYCTVIKLYYVYSV